MPSIFVLDTFTDTLFTGNSAAVCPLDDWLPDSTMQTIAAENNLSETAFIVGKNGRYGTRWFTPKVEVDLCGHATLASGWVVFNRIEPNLDSVSFATQEAGQLTVTRNGDQLSMDFPSRPPMPCAVPDGLIKALGREPIEILAARDCFCVFETEDDVRNLEPDMAALAEVDAWATIVTAPGRNSVDFVSRFFAPRQGIAEDPVTGSAHCTLTPYWAERLGKQTLEARQISARGGALKCSLHGDRVSIAGSVSLYLEGQIRVESTLKS